MAPPPSEGENYKLLFSMISQMDIPKLDWAAIGGDLGIAAGSARARWSSLQKRQMGKIAQAPTRKATATLKKAPKKAVKRKASESEGGDEAKAQVMSDDSGSAEDVGKGKGAKDKRNRGKGAKRVKIEASEHEEFKNEVEEYHQNDDRGMNENELEEYHQDDGQGMNGGNEVEQWLTHQVAPSEGEDDYAIQQYVQYYDDGYLEV
jgi:hypothetical protein